MGIKTGKKPTNGWKPGQSGNPKGAPRGGESWAELIKKIGNHDGPAAAEMAGFLAAQLRKLPAGVNLKTLVVLRVYTSLIDDPQPGLLNAFMDRAEGKAAQPVDVNQRGEVIVRIVMDDAPGSNDTPTAFTSGAGED